MKLRDFKLEVYFNKYEFSAPYLLSQSDCESFTVREILDLEPGADKKFEQSWLGYTEVEGSPALREEIAKLYAKVGPEEILVHASAEEGIFNFMNVLLNRGDHMIVQYPAYQSLYEVADSLGCQVSRWEFRQGEGGWSLDPEELKALCRANTKALVINSPHNPTGYLLSRQEQQGIAEIARENGLFVFADEVYKGLEYEENARLPWFADIYERAVSLGVMSKAYGLAGLRIGWLATQNREIYNRLVRFKHYTSICSSAPGEFLATVALRQGEQILERNRAIIRNNLRLADEFFARYPNLFGNNRPAAGPIAFHKFKSTQPIEDFCADLVDKKGLLLLPGTVYDSPDNCFRMGYGRKSFQQSLEKLQEYLGKNWEKTIK